MMTEKTINGVKIFHYSITDSTNQRAKEYARCADAHFPAVFVADEQTAGRGRRGRSFDSAKGAGLYISFLFRTDGFFDAALITVGAAVKTCRAIDSVSGICTEIKWVNDIFIGNRKLAGILAEGEPGADGYAICGIGINLYKREFPEELSDIAIALEDKCGTRVDKELLTDRLVEEFFKPESLAELMPEYRRRSNVLGRTVEVRKILGEVYTATVKEIADDGALVVERCAGITERLISAEVSIKAKIIE